MTHPTLISWYLMNFSGAMCLENYTEDEYRNYYNDKKNFNNETIWLNPANGEYIHPEQMEFNIQGMAKNNTLLEMMRAL